MQWPDVPAVVPVCLKYLAAASSAASSGQWLQCISHLVALQRLAALEAACHAAVAAISQFAVASAAASRPGNPSRHVNGNIVHHNAMFTSISSGTSWEYGTPVTTTTNTPTAATAAERSVGGYADAPPSWNHSGGSNNSCMSASSAFVGGRNAAYRKILSSASSVSDGKPVQAISANVQKEPHALVRDSLMLDDAICGCAGAQTSSIEIMFPVLDDLFQTVPASGSMNRGPLTARSRASDGEDTMGGVAFEIFDSQAFDSQGSMLSKLKSSPELTSADAQHAGVAVRVNTPVATRQNVEEAIVRAAVPAAAAAAASDAVLAALASAVDSDLPHRAGIGGGAAQVHLSFWCTRTHIQAKAKPQDSDSIKRAVRVVISLAAQSSSSETALASGNAAAWSSVPDVPEPCTHAFDPENYTTSECMLGVRKALGDALKSARCQCANPCLAEVWPGAADKLRPEALSVVTSKNVSPQTLRSSDSGTRAAVSYCSS